MSGIIKVIKERRSTRAFKPSPISIEAIKEILEAGLWAPSGMGKQDWHFTVIHNASKVEQLYQAVGVADHRNESYSFYGAPTVIIASAPRENTNALLDAGAAVQNMLLMAQTLGVGSCWINQVRASCDVEEVRVLLREFGVQDTHMVTATIALGYIAKETQAQPRHENLFTIVE